MSSIEKEPFPAGMPADASIGSLTVRPESLAEQRPGFKMRVRGVLSSDPMLMAIAMAAILLYTGGVVFANAYDNDAWFILATGDYILEHGIPYTNPFSVHEGLSFIAQQWLHCVISVILYNAGGFTFLGIWVAVLFLALAASLFVLGRRLRATRSGSDAVMILVALCVVCASVYASVRPHLYSMIAFTWIVWICEGYRRSGDAKALIALPFIACLHVNLHAALAPYDLFIIVCYALPDLAGFAHRRGKLMRLGTVDASYRRLPLLIVLCACALALLVNPYGVRGALYVFLSFGAASYRNRISEMGHFVPAADWQTIMNAVLMFAVVFVAGRLGSKRINMPIAILAAAGIVGAMAYLRNQWISALFCFMYLAWATQRVQIGVFKKSRAVQNGAAALVLVSVVGMAALMVHAVPSLESEPQDSPSTPVKTVQYLDSIGVDKETTRVFTFFNAGGYLEFNGFKVNMDPRPEIWNSGINGTGRDYYYEYVEMAAGDMAFNAYNDRYDFDVFFIDAAAGTDPYFEDDDYVKIQGGAGYNAYAKKSWIDQYV